MGSMLVIHPHRVEGMWVFDDARAGLVQEPFVSGADLILDRLVANIPDAAVGFTLLFSASPFPGCQARFDWRREEHGGHWYHCAELGMGGWLCPALFAYFEVAHRRSSCSARLARADAAPPWRWARSPEPKSQACFVRRLSSTSAPGWP